MRVEQVMARMRGRRSLVVTVGMVLLVLAGGMVALVGEGAEGSRTAAVLDRDEAAPALPGSAAGSAVGSTGPLMSSEASAMTASGGSTGAGGKAASVAPPVRSGADTGGASTAAGPKIVKNANLRVEVGKGRFNAAFTRATEVAEAHGGFVASSSQATVDERASEGTVTIRVPADRFEAARKDLTRLGTVEHQELSGQDVTAQIVDYDARIRNQQAQEQALSTLLSRANTVGEVLEVQGQLFAVRQQIEQLQAERTNLDAQAAMATITATVFEPGATLTNRGEEPTTGLARSWERAWDGAVAVLGGMVVVLGYLLPLVVLALLAWAAWRLAHRRRAVVPTPAS